MLQCYNKACGQKYTEESNSADSCQYHPGEPIFHDAKKRWSCCKKSSTDFSEFLAIKGCTKGKHSNIKPVEPSKPPSNACDVAVSEREPIKEPSIPKPVAAPQERPDPSVPMKPLKCEVASSLKTLLSKLSLNKKTGASNGADSQTTTATITAGTVCKNSGCKATYKDTASESELCTYHPGLPIFHEGMKYWTCCNRKTTEFDSFMEQVGCETGRHNWTEKDARATNLAVSLAAQSTCRHDWFQMPGTVTVSIYAKAVRPDSVRIEANQVRLAVGFRYGQEDGEGEEYDRVFDLFGTIDLDASSVKLMATKVEIVLRKGEPASWARLEVLKPAPVTSGDNGEAIAT